MIHQSDINDPHPDKERLVNNDSQQSFQSSSSTDENQITVTRHLSDEKYSTMCFKPLDKNMIDVVITNGNYHHKKHEVQYEYVTSQDLRQRYIGKAKCGLAVVFTMIFVMLAVLIYCLLSNPAHMRQSSENGLIPLAVSNETYRNPNVMFENRNATFSLDFNNNVVNDTDLKPRGV